MNWHPVMKQPYDLTFAGTQNIHAFFKWRYEKCLTLRKKIIRAGIQIFWFEGTS